jgi:hypothetical protein
MLNAPFIHYIWLIELVNLRTIPIGHGFELSFQATKSLIIEGKVAFSGEHWIRLKNTWRDAECFAHLDHTDNHLKKFPKCIWRAPYILVNIPCRKEEGYYTYSLRSGINLTLSSNCKNPRILCLMILPCDLCLRRFMTTFA